MKLGRYKAKDYNPERLFIQMNNAPKAPQLPKDYSKMIWRGQELKRKYLIELMGDKNKNKRFNTCKRRRFKSHTKDAINK